jgi:signal transduction histidine kinase
VQGMLQQRQQMLLDVSHELRTPLTRLKLGLEALPEGEARRSLAEDVSELGSLVSELLEGARLEAGANPLKLERVDLAALAQDVAADFDGRAPGLRLDLAALAPIPADPLRLQRLLHNLLSNAFTHGQPAKAPVELGLKAVPGQVELCVRDHGPGLSAADLEQLFTARAAWGWACISAAASPGPTGAACMPKRPQAGGCGSACACPPCDRGPSALGREGLE